MTLSNTDKIRFSEVEDRITREFGDNDTMDFLEYLKQQDSKTRTFSHLLGDQDRVIADFTMEVATLEALNKDLRGENERLKAELEAWVESQT